jgi:lambda repressor-like predicted transcriptional regulator
MTAISMSGASSYTSVLQQQTGGSRPPNGPPPVGGGPMKAAAEALGMDRDNLLDALKDGKSLADLAKDQGVALDDLASALKADMPERLAASGKADDVVKRLVDQKHGSRSPDDGGSRGFAASRLDGSASGVHGTSLTANQQSTLESLGTVLGTDSGSLLRSLRGGTRLTDLFSQKGLSSSKLESAVPDGLLVDTRL